MKLTARTKIRVILGDVIVQPLTVAQAETIFCGHHLFAVQWALEQIKAKPECSGFASIYGQDVLAKPIHVQVDTL